MKIAFEKYNPKWAIDFKIIKEELLQLIGFLNPRIEHIGSTSVEGLSAKPIIDILVGVNDETDLEKTISPLLNNNHNYIYYECFNEIMPYRRLFTKFKINPEELSIPKIIKDRNKIPASTEEFKCRLSNIHILSYDSEHWIRHIAFRDYLRVHPDIKNQYQSLKEELIKQEWRDVPEYNGGKDKFIKTEEKKAIDWYKNLNKH